jgi:hypothetical protein
MAQKNKTLIVLGSLVVIGSVGYYLYNKSKNSKGVGSSEPPQKDEPLKETPSKETPSKETPTKNTKPTYVPPTWLQNTFDIQSFQEWLNIYYPKWLNGKKLELDKKRGYGTLGPSTKAAADSYGTIYLNQLKVKNAKIQFPKGKFVTAKNTISAYAVIVRNGKYMTSDGSGLMLPKRTYNATADLGFVKDILSNGNIVLTVPPEIGPTYGTRIYTDILVRPTDIA